jgi:hypothetical protein
MNDKELTVLGMALEASRRSSEETERRLKRLLEARILFEARKPASRTLARDRVADRGRPGGLDVDNCLD